MKLTSIQIGNSAMIAYAVFTALSSTLIHSTNQKIAPLISAFYTFLFCSLVYNSMTKHSRRHYLKFKTYWREIGILNMTTAVFWISAFISLKYIPPDLFLFVYLCSMPIASSFILRKEFPKALFLVSGILLLVSTYSGTTVIAGSALAFTGGIFGAIYSIYSKKIVHIFSTNEILSLRFYSVVLLSFLLNVYQGNSFILPANFYGLFVLSCFISVVLPSTFFQIGLKHLDLTKAMGFLPLAPILCYAMNFSEKSAAAPNLFQVLIISLLSLSMLSIKTIVQPLTQRKYLSKMHDS